MRALLAATSALPVRAVPPIAPPVPPPPTESLALAAAPALPDTTIIVQWSASPVAIPARLAPLVLLLVVPSVIHPKGAVFLEERVFVERGTLTMAAMPHASSVITSVSPAMPPLPALLAALPFSVPIAPPLGSASASATIMRQTMSVSPASPHV